MLELKKMVMPPKSMLRGVCVDIARCPFINFKVDRAVWAEDLRGGIVSDNFENEELSKTEKFG